MEICPLKIYSGDFSFYEDVFMEIYPLKICLRGFSFYEDLFRRLLLLKICSGEISFEDLLRDVEGHLWKAQWKEKPNDEGHKKLTV